MGGGGSRIEVPAGQTAQTGHPSVAGERHQVDRPFDPRLEAHRGAGRDVESAAPGGLAVEVEGGVGLGEVEVGADLDGPVAPVGHHHGGHRQADVELQPDGTVAGGQGSAHDDLAGCPGHPVGDGTHRPAFTGWANGW